MSVGPAPHGEAALREVLRQTIRSGAPRRAVLLHADRLPPDLSRPHHLRLARDALSSLATADRAQLFELEHGRIAIVWRSRGDAELVQARTALSHLLSGQPDGRVPVLGEILTLYDLPAQADWLLDEIAQQIIPPAAPGAGLALDAAGLAGLEAGLGQADLARFVRWRPVIRLAGASGPPAWEERFFAVEDIAALLCPDADIRGDIWLFYRLTRTLDRRMLALLASPRTLRGKGTFAFNINVETIVAAEFLRFDEALPLALRGEVILNLHVADVLADPSGFAFARRFAQARGYRLALAGATLPLLRLFDAGEAEFDFVELACSAELMRAPDQAAHPAGAVCRTIVTGLDSASSLEWARGQGFEFGRGRALPA